MGFKLKQALLVLTTAFLFILGLFLFFKVSVRGKVFITISFFFFFTKKRVLAPGNVFIRYSYNAFPRGFLHFLRVLS